MNLDDLERLQQKFPWKNIKLEFVNCKKTLEDFSKLHQIDISNIVYHENYSLLATGVYHEMKTCHQDGVNKIKIYNYDLLIALDNCCAGYGNIYDVNPLFLKIHPENIDFVDCGGAKCRRQGELKNKRVKWCTRCSGSEKEYNDWIKPLVKAQINFCDLKPEMILGSNMKFWELDIETMIQKATQGTPDPVLKEILTNSFRSMC